jgi:O-antigen/teichoic acid export membrane protein
MRKLATTALLEGEFSALRQRVLRAVGAEWLGQILNFGVRLVLVPLFLSSWGAETYGQWLILTAAAAWFGLGDLGAQLYFVNRLTAAWVEGRQEEFQELLSTGLFLFLVSSLLLLICVLLALMWPPLLAWLGLESANPGVAKFVLAIMAARFLIAFPVGLLLGVYRALGAQATSVMYANLMILIQFIGSAIALYAGADMSVLATLEIVPQLFVITLVAIDLRKRLPSNVRLFTIASVKRRILRDAVSPSLHFLGVQLSMALMIQGSVIVIAKSLGPVEVAVFSSMRTVSNVAFRFLTMLSHSVWPEFTRLHGSGEVKKLAYIFELILQSGLFIGIVFLVIIQNLGEPLYHWWLNHKLPYDALAMYLVCCFGIVSTLWGFAGSLMMATNQHEEYARLQLPVNLLALWLCYAGATAYGLTGAIVALIAGQSIPMMLTVVLLLTRKNFVKISVISLRASVAAIFLFPLCINLWTGIMAVAVLGVLTVRLYAQHHLLR